MIRAVLILLVVVAIAAFSASVMHKVDQAKLLAYQLAVEQQHAAALNAAVALQAAQDAAARDAAVAEATAQQKIIEKTVIQLRKVVVHVPTIRACVPVGLVRVLVAAARGVDPDSLPLAPGVTDDACTTVGWRDLAAWLIGNTGIAQANAAQLNGLQDALRAMQAAKPAAH